MTDPERRRRVEDLCDAALNRDARERAAFVAAACGRDEALRRDVEALLAHAQTAEGFLAAPIGDVAVNVLGDEHGASLVGRQIGAYKILSLLGAGGMGEVYRARDTKLGRDVAIKVVPDVFLADPERLARFEREARVLAALNHPHIGAIYGLEEADPSTGSGQAAVRALVLELVEGATLAERLALGPLPIREALTVARQIADALDAAHEKGIVHRDLKPGNVKITPDGIVKVLDFGLAKVGAGDGTSPDLLRWPTVTVGGTGEGVILGTPAYMSPEQARGKPIDKRADIWSFGCVLYEMLTGRQAMAGETVSDTIAAILEREPEWKALPDATPATVRRVLQRCLEKDRRQRLRDIGDVRLELDSEEVLSGAPEELSPAGTSRRVVPVAIATALAVALVGVSWIAYRATRPVEQPLKPLVRLDVGLGPDVSLGSQVGTDAILSPDGTRLVYVSKGKLFTRKLDQPTTTELAGTDGAFAPFFSPEGQEVAFFAGGQLKKLSVAGGAPVVLCGAPGGLGGSWSEDGTIIAALSRGGLSRIPSAGGTPTPVTERAPGEIGHVWPQVLPGGTTVLFTSGLGDGATIDVVSLSDHRRKTLQRGGTFGWYVATSNGAGHLVYLNNGTLFAVAFDLDALAVRGTPVPVLDQVAYNPGAGSAQLAMSHTGTLLYRSGGSGSRRVTVQWLDGAGQMHPLLAKPGAYERLHLSPDGQRLVLEILAGSTRDVWIYEGQRDTLTRLTFDDGPGEGMNPVWSPDGRDIVFAGKGGIFWTRADGAGKPQPLTQSKNRQVPFSFTPDGKRLAWFERTESVGYVLWTMPLERDGTGLRGGTPEVFLRDVLGARYPMFSPDGRWLAYTSNESGTSQVSVRAFPDRGGKWQISNGGGTFPVWSRNGREVFFRAGDNRIMVVAYTVKGDSFVADQPRVWSEQRLADFGIVEHGSWSYDLAPDGKRVAALMPVETAEAQQAQNHVIFLQNFFDELRRKVPVAKR